MLWGGSPTAADSGLKIHPVRVRIPLALQALVDAARLKVKLPCNLKRIGVPTIIGRGVRTQRIV